MTARWATLVALAIACGGRNDERAGAASAADTLTTDGALAGPDTVLPPMPSMPRARRGHLAVRAVGSLDFEDAWQARGGRCAEPAMILLIGEDPGRSGGSVLLQLPLDSMMAVDYPVRLADSAGAPSPPAAQLGFQFFTEQEADAYQAAEGVVQVSLLDDRRISGRFEVIVRHITTEQRARMAGVFEQVEVEPLPPDWCERAKSAQDSLTTGS